MKKEKILNSCHSLNFGGGVTSFRVRNYVNNFIESFNNSSIIVKIKKLLEFEEFEKMKMQLDLKGLILKNGFTLAEVLITLGIIGVVAAITIPNLISKYQQIQWRTTYKKVYSSINQVMKYLQTDENFDSSMSTQIYDTGDKAHVGSEDIGRIFKYLARYYNAKTTCFEKNNSKCWECNGEAGSLDGSGAPDWLGCYSNTYSFIDAQGVAYYLYQNVESPIIIDVNGKIKPNQLGRDRFVMYFGDSLEPNNKYPSSIDSVLLWEDIVDKGRWCPQGNCLYKSWIRGQK